MRNILLAILLVSLAACGEKVKDVDNQPMGEMDQKKLAEELGYVPSNSSKLKTEYKLGENVYPSKAVREIDSLFSKGVPVIQPQKFNQTVKLIDKFGDYLEDLKKDEADLNKLQWEMNQEAIKNGFVDLADFVETFIVLSEAHGTYESVRTYDQMIGNNADVKSLDFYEEKLKQRFKNQRLSREDIRYILANRSKFEKVLSVMDELAKKLMSKGL